MLTKTFSSYTFVGLIATATHYLILFMLVDILQVIHPVMATVIGSICGAFVGFILNNQMVFKQPRVSVTAVGKYILLALSNCIFNAILLSLFIENLALPYLKAQLSVTFIIFVSNFFICKLWVFNNHVAKQRATT
jgi:putative flippase GtrA